LPEKKRLIQMDTKKNLDLDHPMHEHIIEAGKIILNQGIVIFPAQCLYGVAANALDPKAVQKIFNIKQRPKNNPILVLIQNKKDLKTLVKTIPAQAEILMDRFWPGSLTLVFKAADHVSPLLTANTGKIGIRVPGHPIARALVQQVQGPVTGTSANISGQPGCCLVSTLPRALVQIIQSIHIRNTLIKWLIFSELFSGTVQ